MLIPRQNCSYTIEHCAEVAGAAPQQPALVERPIVGICALQDDLPDHISYCTETDLVRLRTRLTGKHLTAILISSKIDPTFSIDGVALLRADHPQQSLLHLIALFYEEISFLPSIDSSAVVHPEASVHPSVHIGPFCSVGAKARIGKGSVLVSHVAIYPHATVGDDCLLHSQAVIREGCKVADHCVIQNGAVVGADGFGYLADAKHTLVPIPQLGIASLSSFAEIGANSCVDRASLGKTSIGVGTKIDNLVQVGHNVEIGRASILCSQVGIAGSAKVGDRVTLGGQAGVRDHVTIADDIRVAARGGVLSSIERRGDYAGFPAVPIIEWKRVSAALRQLPKFMRRKNLSAPRATEEGE